jgi:hypothetical protein
VISFEMYLLFIGGPPFRSNRNIALARIILNALHVLVLFQICSWVCILR